MICYAMLSWLHCSHHSMVSFIHLPIHPSNKSSIHASIHPPTSCLSSISYQVIHIISCHVLFRDLEVARMQASDSYRELSELRRSLKDITLDGDSTIAQQSSRGTSSSSSSSIPPTDIDVAQDGDELLCDDSSSSMALLNSSIAEVDRLLHQFQDTLASFSVPSINSTTIYRPGTAASVDNTIEIEMNGFLERYSDKLLDMVLQKLDKSK